MNPTYDTILAAIKKRRCAPLYLLQGNEPYYIDRLLYHFEHDILTPTQKTLNLTTFHGKENSLDQILTRAKSYPMMAAKQVVIVKDAQELADLHKPTAHTLLSHYLSQPNTQTVLVLAHKKESLGKHTKLFQLLAHKAVIMTSQKIHPRKLPAWTIAHAAQKGYQMSPKAALMLTTLLGDNLQLLANELDKIFLELPPKTAIGEENISKHVKMRKAINLFELQDAICQNDTPHTLQIALHATAHTAQNSLLPAIGLLTNFFSKLLQLHELSTSSPKLTQEQVANKIGIHPYFAKKYIAALHHYPPARTIAHIYDLHRADLQAKGINHPTLPPHTILQELVVRLSTQTTKHPLSKQHNPHSISTN